MVLVVLFLIFGFLLQAIMENENYNKKVVKKPKKAKPSKPKNKKKKKAALKQAYYTDLY